MSLLYLEFSKLSFHTIRWWTCLLQQKQQLRVVSLENSRDSQPAHHVASQPNSSSKTVKTIYCCFVRLVKDRLGGRNYRAQSGS